MIQLSGVSKWYQNQVKVLDHIDIQLQRGEFLYLVGGSGAGKSTLLRLLATEEASSAGTVSLFGYSLNQVSPGTLRAIRRVIGYVPQNIRLLPDLSVIDNVSLSLSLAGRRVIAAEARARMNDLLDRLGLADKRHALAGTLSGGEAQRVAVARALVRQPELIIADEPTGAQDRDNTWNLMDLFLRANVGSATVIVATHDREIVRRVHKRCAVLNGGRMAIEEVSACIY